MEYLFSQLKKMDVISLTDGKNLGRVFDVCLLLPENKVKGLYVTGCKGFRLTRSDMFIPVSQIVRVGEDVILVRTQNKEHPRPHGGQGCASDGKDCPPPERGCSGNCAGGFQGGNFSGGFPDPRRDFGEYE